MGFCYKNSKFNKEVTNPRFTWNPPQYRIEGVFEISHRKIDMGFAYIYTYKYQKRYLNNLQRKQEAKAKRDPFGIGEPHF